MRVRFEMVLELLIEYGEHESSSVAHLPNVIRKFFIERQLLGLYLCLILSIQELLLGPCRP